MLAEPLSVEYNMIQEVLLWTPILSFFINQIFQEIHANLQVLSSAGNTTKKVHFRLFTLNYCDVIFLKGKTLFLIPHFPY